jgi:hypothetical protein
MFLPFLTPKENQEDLNAYHQIPSGFREFTYHTLNDYYTLFLFRNTKFINFNFFIVMVSPSYPRAEASQIGY